MKKVLSRIIAAASAALISVVLFAESVFASAEPTFAEKMGQAGRNTVIGIVIVFFILLVLSLIISLFRFIAPKKKNTALKKTEYVNAAKEIKGKDEDEELIAVIMAAIVAAEGETVPPYAYRLKSIKRVKTTRRWNRAR
ncbi:MAG: OadG family protein [Lachnospiraceae bacterium]|nr:OadG family protein [Lachnospiraceae bacterium]